MAKSHCGNRNNPYLCNVFFMVLDLRLIKIGCRETINFFYVYAPCAQLRVSSGTKKASEGEAF